MVGAPPSVPELKSWLGDAIRRLYVSKIPPPPNTGPIIPPPMSVNSAPTYTTKNAPMAPQKVVVPPPLDPSIIKKNTLAVGAPPTVPEIQNKL